MVETLPNGDEFESKYDWNDPFDWVYPLHDFPERLPPIVPGGVYRYQEKMGFRAGSYSGYNRWREQLCFMAHGVTPDVIWKKLDLYKGMPFVELINFSDCEGIIGTDVSKKLLKDFVDYQEMADRHNDEWFGEKYKDWRKAFEYAADNGYVDFH